MRRALVALGVAVSADAAAAPSPYLQGISELSVGRGHVCAVTRAHEVVCWGDNAVGQLGVGTDGKAVAGALTQPHVVGGLPKIQSVAAGVMHTCALSVDGDIWCWGSAGGELKVTPGGTSGSVELRGKGLGTPVKVPLGSGKAMGVELSSTTDDACAVFPGEVRCWTHFKTIPIGAATIQAPALRTVKLDDVTALALGHGAVCAGTKRGMSCWRHNEAPQPVTWRKNDAIVPVSISMGEMYACVASAKGEARCWWSLIDAFWTRPPDKVIRWKGKPRTRAIAVGDSPVCTADVHGTVDCFLSDEGGLEEQTIAESWATTKLEPHPIGGVDRAVSIGIGRGRDAFSYGFGCALRATPDRAGAQVMCWGNNEHGQLGNATTRRTTTATRVLAAQ